MPNPPTTGIGLFKIEEMASHFRIDYDPSTPPTFPSPTATPPNNKVKVRIVLTNTQVEWRGIGKTFSDKPNVLFVRVHCVKDGSDGFGGGGETGSVDVSITDMSDVPIPNANMSGVGAVMIS